MPVSKPVLSLGHQEAQRVIFVGACGDGVIWRQLKCWMEQQDLLRCLGVLIKFFDSCQPLMSHHLGAI